MNEKETINGEKEKQSEKVKQKQKKKNGSSHFGSREEDQASWFEHVT